MSTAAVDTAILDAQLAFIRSERVHQRRQPAAFRDPAGHSPQSPYGKNQRAQQLEALWSAIADEWVFQYQLHPAWRTVSGPVRDACLLLTARVASSGDGLPMAGWLELVGMVCVGDPASAIDVGCEARTFNLVHLHRLPNGAIRVWPAVVPVECRTAAPATA